MPYGVLLLGLLALAYAAPWPVLVNAAAWLIGDPAVYAFVVNTEQWAHHALFFALFLVVASVLWDEDRWLAGIVAMAGAQTFILGPHVTTVYLLIGVGVLMMARRMPPRWRASAESWLGISAVVQSLLILVQWWKGVPGVGTFGVSGVAACYVATLGVLLPSWLLPLVAAAVAASGSRAGLIAFVIGVGVRYAPAWPRFAWALVLLVALAMGASAWRPMVATASASSGGARWHLHVISLRAWASSATAMLVGRGLGRFAADAPGVQSRDEQRALGQNPAHPRYHTVAHDDALQWLYETGLLGAALLAGWLVAWRRRLLAPPFAPAFAVLAVMALAWFPFHDLRTGCVAALLVGLGSPMNEGA